MREIALITKTEYNAIKHHRIAEIAVRNFTDLI